MPSIIRYVCYYFVVIVVIFKRDVVGLLQVFYLSDHFNSLY